MVLTIAKTLIKCKYLKRISNVIYNYNTRYDKGTLVESMFNSTYNLPYQNMFGGFFDFVKLGLT